MLCSNLQGLRIASVLLKEDLLQGNIFRIRPSQGAKVFLIIFIVQHIMDEKGFESMGKEAVKAF